MTRRQFQFWWCVIPANLAASLVNLAITATIPFGLWRWSGDNFLPVLLTIDLIVWSSTFFYLRRHPVF